MNRIFTVRTRLALSHLCVFAFSFFVLACGARASEQVVSVDLNAGNSIRYLLTERDGSTPRYVLVMFPGSEGRLALATQDGTISMQERGNFLVRSRDLFVDDTFATAIVDSPSDQPGGYSDAFRASVRHGEDVTRVLDDLKKRLGDVKFVLVGTSRGTISSSFLGLELGERWDAVVHTSLISRPTIGAGAQLANFDYNAIKPRQLFVQHIHDGCRLCPFDAAQSLAKGHSLIAVDGGSSRGNPCEAMAYHGFNGREALVVQAIKGWIVGGAVPARID